MFEEMFKQLKGDLDAIARGTRAMTPTPDWRSTPIGNWPKNGLITEARRLLTPNWWKRDEPRDSEGREIIRLLERAELGTLRIRDDVEKEQRQFYPKGEARSGTTAAAIAEHQQRGEKMGVDDMLDPKEDESIVQWLGRLAKHIDSNGDGKPFWDGLRAYASRFRGDVSAKKFLDAKVISSFLKHLRKQ